VPGTFWNVSEPSSRPVLSRQRAVSRREQLLNAAAHLFAERGFAGVTMDDIGGAAGISGPALYHHFSGKEAMLGEMLVSISEHLLEQGSAIVAELSTADQALDALTRAHVAFAIDHPELITVHFRDLVQASEADRHQVRRLQARYVHVWVDVLTRRDPQLDDPIARVAVGAVLGLINSTPYLAVVDRDATETLLHAMAMAALRASWY
jgi:AcrR family transcriptional regulator